MVCSTSNIQAGDLNKSFLDYAGDRSNTLYNYANHVVPIYSAREHIIAEIIGFASDWVKLPGSCRADDAMIRSEVAFHLASGMKPKIDRDSSNCLERHLPCCGIDTDLHDPVMRLQ